jgi:hypothetical protein
MKVLTFEVSQDFLRVLRYLKIIFWVANRKSLRTPVLKHLFDVAHTPIFQYLLKLDMNVMNNLSLTILAKLIVDRVF